MKAELPQRDVVLLGAGHTHLHLLRMWKMNPLPGVRLTCVSNQTHATYSGMLPGTLAGNYRPEQARIDLVRRCAAVGARLILAETTGLDRSAKQLLLRDRPPLPYDWLSIGIGSQPAPVEGLQDALSIKPMQTLLPRLERQLAHGGRPVGMPLRVVVVGGGAGGVEIAFCLPAWLRCHAPTRAVEMTVIHRGPRILTGGSDAAAERVQQVFDQRGYQTLLSHTVVAIKQEEVVIEDAAGEQQTLPADLVLWAVGAVGPALFQSFDLAKDAKGFLLTNIHLQSVDDESIFIVGDSGTCQQRPHPKAGVYAVRQGPVLWDNLRAAMQRQPLRQWKPQSGFLSLLNTGDGRAILEYKQRTAYGRWCWWLKDRIDRRFMEKHQDYQPGKMLAPAAPARAAAAMRCNGCGGKLATSVLQQALGRLVNPVSPAVRLGLADAEDVAALQLAAGMSVIATTDFFSAFIDDPYLVGRVAALNALSDLFAKGARPRAALAHAIIPPGAEHKQEQVLYELLAGSLAEFRLADVPIIGGHTIEGQQIVIGFTLLGEHPTPTAMRLKSKLQAGDQLVLTKPLGSGVLLAAHRLAQCRGQDFSALLECMLHSNQAAGDVAEAMQLRAATDVTGFGLLGHLVEMLGSSGLAATLDLAAIPLLPGAAEYLQAGVESSLAPANRAAAAAWHDAPSETTAAYQALFDPQTSGGLLLAVPPEKLTQALERLREHGSVPPAVVGRVVARSGADHAGGAGQGGGQFLRVGRASAATRAIHERAF